MNFANRANLKCAPMLILGLAVLAACNGPKEQEGRDQDRAEAMAAGVNVSGEGPNERLGEAQDRVDSADRKEKDAAADALESRGDQLRRQADIEADKLDEEAEAVRNGEKH